MKNIRFLLIALFLMLGIVFHYFEGIGAAWFLYVGAIILLFTHFLFGNVSAAFMALRKGDIDKAEELIFSIKKPKWLVRQHRAYYYFTKGMVAVQRNFAAEAQTDLQEALQLGLRSDTDRALANLHLATLAFNDNDMEAARRFTAATEKYGHHDLMVKERVAALKARLERR